MYKTLSFLLLFLSIYFLSACTGTHVGDTVRVEQGLMKGSLSADGSVCAFKGVPYAHPPLGELRWKAPEPPLPWEGTRDCSEFGPSAMQSTPVPFDRWTSEFIAPAEPLSEDCLYLNIWTSTGKVKEKKAVLVFIHGGAFTGGSGSVPAYDGSTLAKKGLVVVTINYRLGIFGFLAHPELTAEAADSASGNYAFLDQVEALRWVKKNISAFGGDPDRVTIAGQSAGAYSVTNLVASPLGAGLFSGAVVESGGGVRKNGSNSRERSMDEAYHRAGEVEKHFGVEGIEALRAIPAEELVKNPVYTGPAIDGYFLPEAVDELLISGKANAVPLMIGWNADDAGINPDDIDRDGYLTWVSEMLGDKAEVFLEFFPAGTDEEAYSSLRRLSGLMSYGLPALNWMSVRQANGNGPVYMYNFCRSLPFGEGQKSYGAFHTGEVPYLYGTLQSSSVRPWTDDDYRLSDYMTGYLVNFCNAGDPGVVQGLQWPACTDSSYQAIFFDIPLKVDTIITSSCLDFLQSLW